MAADLGVTDFSIIESHKENIIPLSTGRSARALVAALSTSADGHQAEREVFENELITASDLDDPLDVWSRYVNWTLNTYPSGNSSQSQLLSLLERATRAFQHDANYKNDPRYLKFWTLYIQRFSDAPREHFIYLAKNDIGQRLALFYEEFAAYLEGAGRRVQAREVYQRGLENGARPTERLARKFEEFVQRCEANPISGDEPRSPALPAVRPALAVKTLPFGETGGFADPPTRAPSQPAEQRQYRGKIAIFSDEDNGVSSAPALPRGTGGWDNIGTLEHRRKENIMEPTPWAGQVLKQQGSAGGKAVGGEKLTIFRDAAISPQPQLQLPPTLFSATAFPNAQFIYPNPTLPSLELSFEELRAIQRKLSDIDWASRRRQETESRSKPAALSKTPSTPPIFQDDITTTPPRTQIIQTKMHSPSPGHGKLKKRSQVIPRSPTMTLHTRVATDEIYDLFSQPIDHPNKDLDAEERNGESDFLDDDLTTNTESGRCAAGSDSGGDDCGGESGSGSGRGNEIEEGDEDGSDWSDDKKIDYVDETVGLTDDTYFQKFNQKSLEDECSVNGGRGLSEEDSDGSGLPHPPSFMQPRKLFGDSGERKKPFMTPIVERTEMSLPPTAARNASAKMHVAKTPSRQHGRKPLQEEGKGGLEALSSSSLQEMVDSKKCDESGNGQESGEESDFFLPPPRKLDLGIKEKSREEREKEKSKPDMDANRDVMDAGVHGNSALKTAPVCMKKQSSQTRTDISHKGGPLITETQLNPMTPEIHSVILSKLNPPLSVYGSYFEYPPGTKSKATEIRKSLKPPSTKAAGGGGDKSVEVTFPGKPASKGKPAVGQNKYIFQRQIGEGAFAPVYLVENTTVSEAGKEHQCDEEVEEKFKDLAIVSETRHLRRRAFEAVKLETEPPSAWEFYIMRQVHRRLGVSRPSESILHALEMHLFPGNGGASFLVVPYQNQGTVLDLVNLSNRELIKTQSTATEILTMFLTVELLRTIEALHLKGIIHGDLKPDNCLVRFENLSENVDWESNYRRDGSGGWSKKGIIVIDFGRGIDMRLFPPNVQFVADWIPDPNTDCVEMREMRPWTYQVDYHGCAGIVHSMLFGRYLETVCEKGGGVGGVLGDGVVGTGGGKTWRVRESFKRYWQGEIWTKCFDVLLNPGKYVGQEEGGRLPVTKALQGVRGEMEKWLESNAEKGVGLKNIIKRCETSLKGRK